MAHLKRVLHSCGQFISVDCSENHSGQHEQSQREGEERQRVLAAAVVPALAHCATAEYPGQQHDCACANQHDESDDELVEERLLAGQLEEVLDGVGALERPDEDAEQDGARESTHDEDDAENDEENAKTTQKGHGGLKGREKNRNGRRGLGKLRRKVAVKKKEVGWARQPELPS